MLPLYNHTPLIRIYSTKCRIDLNSLPGRESEFNLADNFSHPEFVDEMWVEDVNSIDEHLLDYQEDTADGSHLQAEIIEDFPDSLDDTDPDFDDGLAETNSETNGSYGDDSDSSDLIQELDHDNSVANEHNQDSDKGTKEPVNLLMLEPVLYWYYPYIHLGNQKYQHNHYLR